jgi:hypothetical protein
MRGRADLFENGTSSLELVVEVTIVAEVSLPHSEVVVRTAEQDIVGDGGSVTAGSSLSVRVNAMDFEGLAITRPDLRITMSLSTSDARFAKRASLLFVSGSTYGGEIPGSWVPDPGNFGLSLSGTDSEFGIHFEVVQQDRKVIYLATGLSAVVAVLLLCAAFLVYRSHGSWRSRVTKVLMPILNVANVALEVWDIYGDYFSYQQLAERRQLVEVPWMAQLYIPYTLFFGLACIASITAILLKLRIFVGFVARTLGGRADAVLDHEQQLADLKKQMAAFVLVGSLEDLPMGAHLACLGRALLRLRAPGDAGILGAYFYFRSDAECLAKLPGCNLAPATAQTMLLSCMTSFLMLGWKFGGAYRMYTKLGLLQKYGALYESVAAAVGPGLAQQLLPPEDGAEAAVAPPQVAAPAAVVAAGPPAAAGAGHADAHPPQLHDALAHPAAIHLIAQQAVPPMPVVSLANMPSVPNIVHAPEESMPAANLANARGSEPGAVRGVCDGCGENVMSNDEGRHREGNKYYHSNCVKGLCGHCNKIVHAIAERVFHADMYWHRACAGNIAGPSGH